MWFRKRDQITDKDTQTQPSEKAACVAKLPSAFAIPGLRVCRGEAADALTGRLGGAHVPAGELSAEIFSAPVSVWTFEASAAAGCVRGGRFSDGAPERLKTALAAAQPPDLFVAASGSAAAGDGLLSEGYADALTLRAAATLHARRAALAAVGPTNAVPAAGAALKALDGLRELDPQTEAALLRSKETSPHEPIVCAFPLVDEAGSVNVAGWFWRDPAVMVLASDLPIAREAAQRLLDEVWLVGPDAWSIASGPHPGDALVLLSAAPGRPLALSDVRIPTLLRAWRLAAGILIRKAVGEGRLLRIEGAVDGRELSAAARVWVPAVERMLRAEASCRQEILFRAMAATPLTGLERSRIDFPPFLHSGRAVPETEDRKSCPKEWTLKLERGIAEGVFPLELMEKKS